jgi:hypothetical protein
VIYIWNKISDIFATLHPYWDLTCWVSDFSWKLNFELTVFKIEMEKNKRKTVNNRCTLQLLWASTSHTHSFLTFAWHVGENDIYTHNENIPSLDRIGMECFKWKINYTKIIPPPHIRRT